MKNTNWKVPVIIGIGVLAVILMIVFGVQSSQNKAIVLEEQVNTASSDIKVQEKRRVDLVYNLADCVKQYDKAQAEILKQNGDDLEKRAEQYVIGIYGSKEGKTNTDDFEKTKKDFINANSYELIDPIKILDKINTLEESIASFKAEVDASLSTSNAVTEIEINY